MTQEKLLKIQEVADRLSVHSATVRRLIAAGKLPAVRVGKSLRIEPQALEAYIQAAKETPDPVSS